MGRTVVLTGSTGGLGAALAQALRTRGANLALLDLDHEAGAAQAQAVGGATVARGRRADVRDLASLQTGRSRSTGSRPRSASTATPAARPCSSAISTRVGPPEYASSPPSSPAPRQAPSLLDYHHPRGHTAQLRLLT
ncbi:SDR family NAD(P)-dependent oxidoreductase [Saccharothrix sp. CCNWYY140]|uniref:SDR family NAD(P)-dependent oxidoreductase n=1 Tax=unclassified Saccharothrix TaxID=2593673 RepID=UPI003FD2654B